MLQATWSAEMLTGADDMDELHRAFFDTLMELSLVNDEKFSLCYATFVEKTERLFAIEDRWMEEIDFPALQSHREQHARVLGALHNVASHVMGGDLVIGRDVIERLLPQWCVFHMTTMDMALGMFMQMARHEVTSQQADQWIKLGKAHRQVSRSNVIATRSMEI